MKRKLCVAALLLVSAGFLSLSIVSPAQATEGYARKTGKGCIFCHEQSTGGALKTVGFAYIKNGYQYPIPQRILKKAEALQTPFHKTLRFIIGYIHLLAAIVFFGAIFYIHIFVNPTRLTGGIPKPERILGVTCMVTLTLSGVYLTWVRISRWEQFFNNTFGLMLFIKILLFALMVAIGITAITVVNRRMKRERQGPDLELDTEEITRANLSYFDGSSGQSAYVIFENKLYDVSESEKWKGGRHLGKHTAGQDLTEALLQDAPHGPEVLERVKYRGEISAEQIEPLKARPAQKVFIVMAYTNLAIIFLILACISVWRWGFPLSLLPERRAEVLAGKSCVQCHQAKTPGIFYDWQASVHARVGVDCYKCHMAASDDLASRAHLENDPNPIAVVVTPQRCASCHPEEARQYALSKHANTHAIIWKVDHWLNDGMNNAIERLSGCYACHGTVVKVQHGKPASGTWPNVGVGRINPDGSLGSCSSCHTRHRFSMVEARKPEACEQCHLGPDHPQIEIYNESKHGSIYHAEGHAWTWSPDDRKWQAGRDFRTPTCAACHMSAAGAVPRTHDLTERLAWETQAPLTVRPSAFKPFPARTDWKEERQKMKQVCLQCHSPSWTDGHFHNLDEVVSNYNENYFKPIKARLDELYDEGLLSRERYFDEPLEWEFYELWHHEGRRARMGAAMMAPDYAWWHGFYELKHRFNHIIQTAQELRKRGQGPVYKEFPGKYEK